MKILVTGGDGQLGRSLRKCAVNYPDHAFTFIDINDLDLTDPVKTVAYVTGLMPGILINCAAYTAVDKAEEDSALAMNVNAEVPGKLAWICSGQGIKLIHISTDYVFDGKSYMPYSEDDPCNPASAYAKSKYEGEREILRHNVSGIIIRTSWLYSEYGHNFVKTILAKGIELGNLRVVYDQIGGPTYAGDLAKTLIELIPRLSDSEKMEIFNYANEGAVSWYDFAKAIIDIGGIDCKIQPVGTIDYPTPAARPPYSVFNKTKIRERFGIEIPYWRDSLKVCIRNLKSL
ncbi:MAG: dTDP-4-dehydrorhamnose reductase [Bacteroidetes bacterium]|nr:dTDP-4-dehydrorhamnose reductase [Bacteroidota bacterium]